MGGSKNHHFYDFGTFGRVPEPKNNYFCFWDTSIPNKNAENSRHIFKNTNLVNINISKTLFLKRRNRRTPKNDEDPRKQSSNSWIWISYLSKNMKWKFDKSYISLFSSHGQPLIPEGQNINSGQLSGVDGEFRFPNVEQLRFPWLSRSMKCPITISGLPSLLHLGPCP